MSKMMVPFLLLGNDQLACAKCHRRMNQEEVQMPMERKGLTPWRQTWTVQNVFCTECALVICGREGDIAIQ